MIILYAKTQLTRPLKGSTRTKGNLRKILKRKDTSSWLGT